MGELTEYVILPGTDYRAACDAVREKTGKTDGIRSGDLAAQIRGIAPKLQEKTVIPTTQRQTVEADAYYEGLSAVTVAGINLQEKTAAPGTEAQTILPDDGYDGLEEVVIAAMKLQEKTAVPSETAQTIEPDAGFDGLAKVLVEAAEKGTAVQVATGSSLRLGRREEHITTGFRPDMVVIHGFRYYDTHTRRNCYLQLACLFESENEKRLAVVSNEDYYIVEGYITQESTGFSVSELYGWYWDENDEWVADVLGNYLYTYTAVKYTE